MSEHRTAPATYGLIFVALIALTGLTVLLGDVDLGHWHTPVGLAIAATKATLIVLFFMHLVGSPRLTWLVAGGTLLFLSILLGLTLSDYLTRNWKTGSTAGLVPSIAIGCLVGLPDHPGDFWTRPVQKSPPCNS